MLAPNANQCLCMKHTCAFSHPLTTHLYPICIPWPCPAAGANLAACDPAGDTALHMVVSRAAGSVQIYEQLMGSGANPNLVNKSGNTPLHLSISSRVSGAVDMASAIINSGRANLDLADVCGNTALILCATQVQRRLMQELLQRNADPNRQNQVKQTALIVAAAKLDNEMVVQLLSDHHTNANLQDTAGDTALHACLRPTADNVWAPACATSILQMAGSQLLLGLANSKKEVPLLMLAKYLWSYASVVDVAKLMLAAPSSAFAGEQLDQAGLGVLHYSLRPPAGSVKPRNELLALTVLSSGKAAPDLQAKDGSNQTALHLAVDSGCSAVVTALISCGCRTDITDAKGDTGGLSESCCFYIQCCIPALIPNTSKCMQVCIVHWLGQHLCMKILPSALFAMHQSAPLTSLT